MAAEAGEDLAAVLDLVLEGKLAQEGYSTEHSVVGCREAVDNSSAG